MIGVLTFASTLLALVRDRLFAHIFGAGLTLDIYYAAFRIPDMLFISIGSLMSAFVLIPALAEAKKNKNEISLIQTVTITFGSFLVLSSAVLMFCAPAILTFLYPSLFERGGGDELVLLTRILLLQPILLGLSNVASSVVQFYGRYTLFAFAPILYSIGVILGGIIFYPIFGTVGLGYGVLLGALLHFLIQAPFFYAHGLSKKLSFVSVSEIVHIAFTSVPRTISLACGHAALLAMTAYASTVEVGAITLFMFAFNLQSAPLSIVGASYSVAAFPTLSVLYKEQNMQKYISLMTAAARHILFWSLPITALCIILRAHIVRLILGSGAFSWSDTRVAAAVFAMFVLSLAAQGLILLFVRGYYAAEKTLIPLTVSACTAFSAFLIGYLLSHVYSNTGGLTHHFVHSILRLSDTDNASIAMLALGFSIASILGATVLVMAFSYLMGSVRKEIMRALREGFVGAVMAGAGSYGTLQVIAPYISMDVFWGVLAQTVIAGTVGTVFAASVLYLIGNVEVREVYRALHSKMLWKVPVSGADEPQMV